MVEGLMLKTLTSQMGWGNIDREAFCLIAVYPEGNGLIR
jgi:hypothetical protein